MAAPTAAPPPPTPPPAEPVAAAAAVAEQKVSHTPLTRQPDALAAAKKRKLEDAGFHASAYYKIRSTVADLRLRFVQVYEATDFRNNDAAREILKEIKVVMELSKKTSLDLSATSEPVKPSEKPLAGTVKDGPAEPTPSGEKSQVPQTEIKVVMQLSKKMSLDLSATSEPVKPSEKPLAGAVKDGPAEPTPSGEKSQVPQTGQTAISSNNVNDGVPPKTDKSGSAAEKMLEATQISEMADHPKHVDEIAQGLM